MVVMPQMRVMNALLVIKQPHLDLLGISEVVGSCNVFDMNAVVLPHVLGELCFKFRQIMREF
jgi:hypothetical protein